MKSTRFGQFVTLYFNSLWIPAVTALAVLQVFMVVAMTFLGGFILTRHLGFGAGSILVYVLGLFALCVAGIMVVISIFGVLSASISNFSHRNQPAGIANLSAFLTFVAASITLAWSLSS